MLTFNVLLNIRGKKKHKLFKSTDISLLFRSFINVKSNYKKKNTHNSAT